MASGSSSSSVKYNKLYPFIPDYMQEGLLELYKREEAIAIEKRGKRRGINGNSYPLQETERREAQEELLNIIRQTAEYTLRVLNTATFATAATAMLISEVQRPKSIREVWSATSNPPIMVLSNQIDIADGNPTQEARTCFKIKEKVDYFFRTEFQRPPVLNANQLMKTTIEHPCFRNECFWDADEQAVIIGKWEDRHFNTNVIFTNTDILTHEFGHAVTHFSSNFADHGQSGALDEATSDIFAIMHKHRLANVDANSPDASWEIAEGLIKNSDGTASPLRSMKEPGTAYVDHPELGRDFSNDPQILHVNGIDDKIWTDTNDRGGVHVYSGIPNHAFYLMATEIGGKSWEIPGKIWFRSLLQAKEGDDFATFAGRTVREASSEEYPRHIQAIIEQAWFDVGVTPRRTRPKHR